MILTRKLKQSYVTRAMLVAKQRVGLPFDLSSDYSIR